MKMQVLIVLGLSVTLGGCLEDFNLDGRNSSANNVSDWYACKTPENEAAFNTAREAFSSGHNLYSDYCAECHSDRRSDASNSIPSINEIEDGRDWTETKEAINENEGGMGKLQGQLTDAQLVEMANFLNAYFHLVPPTCDDDDAEDENDD